MKRDNRADYGTYVVLCPVSLFVLFGKVNMSVLLGTSNSSTTTNRIYDDSAISLWLQTHLVWAKSFSHVMTRQFRHSKAVTINYYHVYYSKNRSFVLVCNVQHLKDTVMIMSG